METWLVSTGDQYKVFETDFANIDVATCWEIAYPEVCTIYALKGADIIFNHTMGRSEIKKSVKKDRICLKIF